MKTTVCVNAIRGDGKAVKLFSSRINSEALWYNITESTRGVDLLEKGAKVLAYLALPTKFKKNGHLIAAYPVRKPN